MKKSIILKSFLVILVSMMLVFVTSTVHAETASNAEYEDLFGEGSSNTNNTSNTGNTNNANANANRSNTNNTNRNNTNRNNTNTTLPKTGIEDSLPTALLVIVFAISAVYAYKKIKDYRNID